MLRLATLAAILLALTSLQALADLRLVSPGQLGSADAPRVEVVASSESRVTLDVTFPALVADTVSAEGRRFQMLSIPGGDLAGGPGEPAIPVFSQLLAIPAHSGATVTATAQDEVELAGVVLVPVQDESEPVFSLDPASYARSGFGTENGASVGGPGLMRGLRVVSVTLRPVRFDPAGNRVRVAQRMRVEVRFEGEDLRNAAPLKARPIPPSFDLLYRALVPNYAGPPEGTRTESGTWLVICPNDVQVTSRLQPLLDWRKRKGLNVRLATTAETGSSAQEIHTYIQNAYELWSQPPEYVVLAGDANGNFAIPTFFETYSGSGGEGDNPYVLLAGDDPLPEAHVGRLSFSTLTELETIVSKIVGYESNPSLSDPSWLTRACLVGDPGASGLSTVLTMQWIKTRLRQIGYTQIDTVFSDPFVAQMTASLNRGSTLFSYRGTLGMSGWTNTNTYALLNGPKMPFCVISTCGTGSFSRETSPSEAFLRSGTPVNPKAGVGAIGTATTGTHTRFNNCLTYGVFQGLLYDGIFEMGAALTRGKVELYRNYWDSPQSNSVWIFCHWNNLMGDPAAPCWTSAPRTWTIEAPDTLAVGSSFVSVAVTESGFPVPGARVCLWKSNQTGGEVYSVGSTDENGISAVPLALNSAGNLLLTVTDHEHLAHLRTIPVVVRPRQIGYQSAVADDDGSGESQGNGDALINPGETIELRVQARNFGTQAVANVTGTVSTSDPYVTLTDAEEIFGNLPAGGLVWSQDDFGFTVDPRCPHGHPIRLDLRLSSGAEEWNSWIPLTVSSACLEAGLTTVLDGGNGILDPGETADLIVDLRNTGTAGASEAVGTLSSMSPWVTVLDSIGSYGTVPPGGVGENGSDPFRLQADLDTYRGRPASFRLATTFNQGRRDTTYFTLTVGQRAVTDPVGPDRYGYLAFDNGDLAFPDAPVYGWIELNPAQGGDGVEIPLNDYGDYQDKSRTVNLPFEFQFYGDSYLQATVCSNGWIALGSTYLVDYRNWSIPGAGAPSNLLAVFWDDLYRQSGDSNSKIFQKYDAAGHRWIVEWCRLRNVGGVIETFEAILYDPHFHPTGSSDGIVVYQYQTVANVDAVDGYATVGIQNSDHTDGVLFTYFDRYPPGAAPLSAGRAIRFVPLEAAPRGSLEGTVRNSFPPQDPLEGARVVLLETGREMMTGADGRFTAGIPAGTYTVTARKTGFEPDTIAGVVVNVLETTTLEFLLRDNAGPEITNVSIPGHTPDTAGPYEIRATVADPSGLSAVRLFTRVDQSPWQEIPMSPAGGEYAGFLQGRPVGTRIEYFVSALDGWGNEGTAPPAAPDSSFALHVTSVTYAYDAEAVGNPPWTLGLPADDADSGVWIREDPMGTEYNGQPMSPEDDHTPAPGVACFNTGRRNLGGGNPEGDVDGGCTSLLSPTFDLSHATQAWVSYWRWFALGGTIDDAFQVYVSSNGGTSWRTLETVVTNQNAWSWRAFDLSQVITLTDRVVFHFVACDLNAVSQVEAALDDFAMEVFIPTTTGVPEAGGQENGGAPAPSLTSWARPNPFTEGALIGFYLKEAGPVRLTVHDVQGRVVRDLAAGSRSAGAHAVRWDGRGDEGPLPSGVYFYRLQAGGRVEEHKLIRLE